MRARDAAFCATEHARVRGLGDVDEVEHVAESNRTALRSRRQLLEGELADRVEQPVVSGL